MSIKARVEYDVAPFRVPNYVVPVKSREDGVSEETRGIPLADLSAETLDTLCHRFCDEVFKKAGKDRPAQPL